MKVTFGTKAETLARLSSVLKHCRVLPQVCFYVSEWQNKRNYYLNKIKHELPSNFNKIIVRSSANEDSLTMSNAGHFSTVGNIERADEKALIEAVRQVIDSYGEAPLPEYQVFAQPFLEDVHISGVVFTRDIDTLAPYYIVNYDDQTKATDSVTSGRHGNVKTLIKFRDYLTGDKRFLPLFRAIEEIEQHLNCDHLDIEFAIGSDGTVYLLQVRPIVHSHRELPDSKHIGHYLRKLYNKIVKLNKTHPYLYGHRTLFGVMPDWNPAEMIGVKPRPLALSLYKYLITDRVWAYQRDNYGYKNLRSFPLLVSFLGIPYIDVRVSFNSFIPKDLDDVLSGKLTNYYLDCLQENLDLHDKVEFEILFSCYFLGIDEKIQKVKMAGFSDNDLVTFKESLRSLTNNIISQKNGVFQKDLEKIEYLKERQHVILNSHLSVLEKIYWLIEDCCRYGTLPFAGLARAAFISVQMLRSFVSTNLISNDEMNSFMASLNTVAKQMAHDHLNMSREDFLEMYGHLRPGTYDILSERYADAYDFYFKEKPESVQKHEPFEFNEQTLKRLDRILKKEGLLINAQGIIHFFKKAIEGREYAKFVFTRSVSEVLILIKRLGLKYGLSIDDASFLNISTLLYLYSSLDHRDLSKILKEESDRNKDFYEITKAIKLPSVINKPEDIFEFNLEEGSPNFITLNRAQGEVVRECDILKVSLSKKIVFISSADPGYDWIFSKNISGLVTMYGGANSHMAIRAAELKIPSVIGAGEKKFNSWNKASVLEIDCENKLVKILR